MMNKAWYTIVFDNDNRKYIIPKDKHELWKDYVHDVLHYRYLGTQNSIEPRLPRWAKLVDRKRRIYFREYEVE